MEGLVILAFGALGFYLAWRQFTDGTGFVGKRLSEQTLASLNDGSTNAKLKKAGLSALLGYFILAFWLVGFIVSIAFRASNS